MNSNIVYNVLRVDKNHYTVFAACSTSVLCTDEGNLDIYIYIL